MASSPMYTNVEIVDLSSNLAENSVDAVIPLETFIIGLPHKWILYLLTVSRP